MIAHAQPTIQWQRSLGGSGSDVARFVQITNDGGYAIGGSSYSNDGDVSGNHGGSDAWVAKLDPSGVIQWQKSLGGSADDFARAMQATSDGGYILAGWSSSNDGDVSGNHGNTDYWIVKSDSTGVIQWQRSSGGSGNEGAYAIQKTGDGGYILAGVSDSNDGDVSGNHGGRDGWVVKLDSVGAIEWQKSLGGSSEDEVWSVQPTSGSGYIVTGWTFSNDGDVSGNHGEVDCWLVKLDNAGNIQWQKSLGGSAQDAAFSIQITNDNGYILTGWSSSNDGDVSGNHGSFDAWMVKLDSTGVIQWQRSLGGSAEDIAIFIQTTSDGGYVLVGNSTSSDGDATVNHGFTDFWVVKLDPSGAIQWQKSLGGSGYDGAVSLKLTGDDGYIVVGHSDSNDGDVSGNHGESDFWVVKLSPVIIAEDQADALELLVFPNPVSHYVEIKTTENDPVTRVALVDVFGRILLDQSLARTGRIDVSLLPDGVYMIDMVTQSGKRAQRMIVKQ
ncbi:MAG: hypothetical protein EPGJADBJ_02614 [Saprospiraceae bacterium]|nr:hypothetical protein [Saprospiraceae bacterium]